MEIAVKCVKYGDCSIIKSTDGKQQLLIDCGSDNVDGDMSCSKFAFSTIEKEINSNAITHLMISHYDKDHCNGILEIPSSYKFDAIFLPFSVVDPKKSEIIYSGPIARLLTVASPRSWGFKLAQNMIELFTKLDSFSGEIRCLKAGDTFSFGGKTIRILWPKADFPFDSIPVKVVKEKFLGSDDDKQIQGRQLESIIKWNPEYHETFNDQRISGEYDYNQKPMAQVEEALIVAFNDMVLEGSEEFYAYSSFHNAFNEYLSDLHSISHEDLHKSFVSMREAYDILDETRANFRKKKNKFEINSINSFACQQYHSLVTGINAMSIVCDCEQRFAYLGDAPKNVITYLSPEFNGPYKCVKIQHHGTQRYYTDETPVGDNYIISNGGYVKRKVCSNFIDGGKSIICTNAHSDSHYCYFHLANGSCGHNCIHASNQQIMPV